MRASVGPFPAWGEPTSSNQPKPDTAARDTMNAEPPRDGSISVLMFHMEQPHSVNFDAQSKQSVASLIKKFCNQTRCCFENILIVCNGRFVIKDPAVSVWDVHQLLSKQPAANVVGSVAPQAFALGVCENPGVTMLLKRAEYYEKESKRLVSELKLCMSGNREQEQVELKAQDVSRQLSQYREWLQDARRTQSEMEVRMTESTRAQAQLQHKVEEAESSLKRSDNKHLRIERRLRDRLACANQQVAQMKTMKRGQIPKDFRPRHVQQAEINRLKERTKNLEGELDERDAELEDRNKQLHTLRRELCQMQDRVRHWETECHHSKKFHETRQRMFQEQVDVSTRRTRQLELENERLTELLREQPKVADPAAGRSKPRISMSPATEPFTVNQPRGRSSKPRRDRSKLRRDAQPFQLQHKMPVAMVMAMKPCPGLLPTVDQAITSANGMNTKASVFVPSPTKKGSPGSGMLQRDQSDENIPCMSVDESIWGPDAGFLDWATHSFQASDSELSVQRVNTPMSILSSCEDQRLGELGQAHLPTSLLREMLEEDQGFALLP